ncbi:hypothetical protein SS209_00487 [Salmonella enterica subsp. enterica serovar Senftenberg str. SS209]|nr:hypothetical protein SS209_00487 [Salmonella enterica subsp. enterica serovar Senftenberg str. SS209]
MMSVPDGD